jgi:hypothetical protein
MGSEQTARGTMRRYLMTTVLSVCATFAQGQSLEQVELEGRRAIVAAIQHMDDAAQAATAQARLDALLGAREAIGRLRTDLAISTPGLEVLATGAFQSLSFDDLEERISRARDEALVERCASDPTALCLAIELGAGRADEAGDRRPDDVDPWDRVRATIIDDGVPIALSLDVVAVLSEGDRQALLEDLFILGRIEDVLDLHDDLAGSAGLVGRDALFAFLADVRLRDHAPAVGRAMARLARMDLPGTDDLILKRGDLDAHMALLERQADPTAAVVSWSGATPLDRSQVASILVALAATTSPERVVATVGAQGGEQMFLDPAFMSLAIEALGQSAGPLIAAGIRAHPRLSDTGDAFWHLVRTGDVDSVLAAVEVIGDGEPLQAWDYYVFEAGIAVGRDGNERMEQAIGSLSETLLPAADRERFEDGEAIGVMLADPAATERFDRRLRALADDPLAWLNYLADGAWRLVEGGEGEAVRALVARNEPFSRLRRDEPARAVVLAELAAMAGVHFRFPELIDDYRIGGDDVEIIAETWATALVRTSVNDDAASAVASVLGELRNPADLRTVADEMTRAFLDRAAVPPLELYAASSGLDAARRGDLIRVLWSNVGQR